MRAHLPPRRPVLMHPGGAQTAPNPTFSPDTLSSPSPPPPAFRLLLTAARAPAAAPFPTQPPSSLIHVAREDFRRSKSEPGTPQCKPSMAPTALGTEPQFPHGDPTAGSVASDALRPLQGSAPCCPLCQELVGFPGSCVRTGLYLMAATPTTGPPERRGWPGHSLGLGGPGPAQQGRSRASGQWMTAHYTHRGVHSFAHISSKFLRWTNHSLFL